MVGADATVQYMLGFLARYVETKAALAVTGLDFMQNFRSFLGQCGGG